MDLPLLHPQGHLYDKARLQTNGTASNTSATDRRHCIILYIILLRLVSCATITDNVADAGDQVIFFREATFADVTSFRAL
jgi:hypothetical protein